MRAAVCLLAAPLLIGCGDVLYDQNQRALILDPVERVAFDVDIGSVEVYAFDRTAISLLFYLRGAESQIDDIGWDLEEDQVHAFIGCKTLEDQRSCIADFYCEVPLGTAVVSHTTRGDLKLTGVDAPVEATVAGNVDGFDLRAPTLDLDVTGGDVTLTLLDPPQSVRIALDAGIVDITLPAGPYRCDLDAQDGEVNMTGVLCDDAAGSSLEISVGSGDINLQVAS